MEKVEKVEILEQEECEGVEATEEVLEEGPSQCEDTPRKKGFSFSEKTFTTNKEANESLKRKNRFSCSSKGDKKREGKRRKRFISQEKCNEEKKGSAFPRNSSLPQDFVSLFDGMREKDILSKIEQYNQKRAEFDFF